MIFYQESFKRILPLFIGIQFIGLSLFAQPDILVSEWKRFNPSNLPVAADYDPFPEWRDQSFWQSVPESLRKAYIAEGEKALNDPYPILPASLFLEFVKNGNRGRYESQARQRRNMLQALVLAECFERRGRFLEKIADGIWIICEETYWGVPAHLSMQKAGFGLPDVTEPTMDLFAGETAALLAITYHLLEKELNTISPMVCKRLLYEADRRVLTPNLTRTDFWWMSFDASLNNGTINNWNPWCNSNWLITVMLLEKDPDRKRQAMQKIVTSLDKFVNHNPPDGGCDEGPVYWGRAGGSLFDALELLFRYTGGRFNVFPNPLIQNIGSYIYKAHIRDNYFVNFADAAAKANISVVTVFMYGKRIANDTMQALAKEGLVMQNFTSKASLGLNGIFRNLMAFGALPEMQAFNKQPAKSPFYWFPYLQVMVARKTLENGKELLVAAQGGHNAESHNHNDVGNFVVYADGKPVLIDVGVESYTAKTFSSERYSIWTMQSQYHNVPTINGFQQKEGKSFAAKNVSAKQLPNGGSFMLDISGAYPADAGIKEWKRNIVLDNADKVNWTDQYGLTEVKGPTIFHFMTQAEPVITPQGILIKTGEASMILGYDLKKLEAGIDKIDITDAQLKANWGDVLYRISLKVKTPANTGRFSFSLSRQPS